MQQFLTLLRLFLTLLLLAAVLAVVRGSITYELPSFNPLLHT
jgi:hypothetical protein